MVKSDELSRLYLSNTYIYMSIEQFLNFGKCSILFSRSLINLTAGTEGNRLQSHSPQLTHKGVHLPATDSVTGVISHVQQIAHAYVVLILKITLANRKWVISNKVSVNEDSLLLYTSSTGLLFILLQDLYIGRDTVTNLSVRLGEGSLI